MAKKKKGSRRGRASRRASVIVTVRLPKDVSDQVEALRKQAVAEVSRTGALVARIRKGLASDDKALAEIADYRPE